ncbi:hypothetical protein CC78DRAFT_619630 [Lojkania enalia]|uniref:Kelch repeat protein n=1 Tax=Lojkania enalia TaxID=147567 RepID=A0A9P4K2Y3_9PLEO|nr:hypothetical protein CC78DRAFT_619630 [Didymosphaeria enalia]
MRTPFSTLIVFVFACLSVSSRSASTDYPVNVDDLDPLKECKRREVKLAQSDNKVYMYGGQSWVKNGTEKPFQITNHYLRIADFTSARNLSDRSILSAKDIPGNITIFQNGAFWADSRKVYVAGGDVNDEPWLSRQGQFLPSNFTYVGGTIFSYDLDADEWTSEPGVQPNSGFRVNDTFCCGSFAYNAGYGKAYFYSGNNGAGARKLYPDTVPGYVGRPDEEVIGNGNLLTFDPGSFRWSNVTTDEPLTTIGTENGQFVFLPGTTSPSGGIGILLGGMHRETKDMESMRKVLVYDSGTDSWYGQATTVEGDPPSGRWRFCAVAASAPDNSSHNIYIYAGESPNAQPDAYSDMWILSIPSFHWIHIDVYSPPRKALGCTTVAERYMVTYGGIKLGWDKEGDEDECDQENYGLRLFDLSNLAWTSWYEGPSATNAFTVPKLVYDVIGGNEQGGATQTTPKEGFETAGLTSLFQRSSPTIMYSTTSSLPTNTAITSKTSTNTGAIAGGVAGGVVGLTLVITGCLCFMKRRIPRLVDAFKISAPSGPNEVEGQPTPCEVEGQSKFPPVVSAPYEVDGQSRYPRELAG